MTQKQLAAFLKRSINKNAVKVSAKSDVDELFDRLDAARTLGDLRRIVDEVPLDVVLKAADEMTIFRQYMRLSDRCDFDYENRVRQLLAKAKAEASPRRRCFV